MLVRHSSYFCKSEKSCSTHCCCCWVLLSCCGLYLSLLCSFPCISNICNFYIPVDSWYHQSVSYILMKCYKKNIKIVLNLSLLKGMKQLIRFLSHLFALLPIDFFKVIIFINWHMASPNYDSFWSNSSLWLHKCSIADEKVYLQGWMLNRSTIKSITILSPLTVDKIVQKKVTD